ncbi:unnamed protein product [Phyllotreta striolata]|uniref:Myb/SANT-like DNA-binding domain-containing protein n=1 Tax=Phyllotreta striolata TaxID=444603 RepID=A0A9N9TNP9_PHYSR|nr:unnamed protein product [Phyllotreta striolata]
MADHPIHAAKRLFLDPPETVSTGLCLVEMESNAVLDVTNEVILCGNKENLVFPEGPSTSSNTTNAIFSWSHENTLLLIELFGKYRQSVGSFQMKSLKHMFLKIAEEMRKTTGSNVAAGNCENRWKVLERNYKKFLDNSNQTGRGRKTFEYASHMNDILGKKRNISPLKLLCANQIDVLAEVHTQPSQGETIEVRPNVEVVGPPTGPSAPSQTPRIKNEGKRSKQGMLHNIRCDRREYYQKRLNIEEKKLQLEEKKLEEKVKKNKLLQEQNRLLEERNNLLKDAGCGCKILE